MRKMLILILAGVMAGALIGCTKAKSPENNNPITRIEDNRGLDEFKFSLMNLCGTDDVGRRLETADNYKSGNKTVGLFYSLWLGQHRESQTDIYDISALLATSEGVAALNDSQPNALSRPEEFHFASQPLYGYYNMADPWVVNRHVELLTMAGIDYLCFDATNSVLYQKPTFLVLDTLLKYQKEGWDVPKAMFYTNSFSGKTVKRIYNEFYQTEKYNSIWWAPEDKPMIMGITENNKNASDQTKYQNPDAPYTDFVSGEMQEFFDVWESQWPNGDLNDEKGIPWMSWQYPQKIHKGSKSMSVSVAQHSPSRINMSYMDPQSSRGYDYVTESVESKFWEGKNFANEWDAVFANEDKVENVMVTSFNEWMAIKGLDDNGYTFCDVYNTQYSRDIEMSNDVNKDNFTMQMIDNVKKYKYTEGDKNYKWKQLSIDINDDSLVMWEHANAYYKDFDGDAIARNFDNAVGTFKYTDNSNRNDITDIKVTHDKSKMYFYVKTKAPITKYNGTDKNWMNILISTTFDNNGFAGYNYIINRAPSAGGKTSVEKSKGGYNWESAGNANYKIYDNVMLLAIDLADLGLTPESARIEFKVADHVTKYDDIMDYYVSGDSAPIGRLSYSYGK